MRILAEDTAAIAIDYQERLIPVIDDKETVIRNSQILLAGLELANIPLIVSRQYPKGLGDTIPEIQAVTTKATVLDKSSFSCYADAEIKKTLEKLTRKNIILCGTEAHICVLQTAVDLCAAGYTVIYVTDCVGSRTKNNKKYAIKRLAQEGALLTTYEQILFELIQGAASPVFKDISRLVK